MSKLYLGHIPTSEEIRIETSDISSDGMDIPNSKKFELISKQALSRRQIHIFDEIEETTFEQIKNLYDQLIEDDIDSPIHFIIGTPGGEVRIMMAIMNLMLLSKTPCYTYLFGETCSAGSWIYLCGQKRFAPKTNLISFMLHPMEWDYSDNLGNHDSQNKYLQKVSQNLIDFALQRTTFTRQKLQKLVTNETKYFVGDEIFKYGIATDELVNTSFWLPVKPINTISTLVE